LQQLAFRQRCCAAFLNIRTQLADPAFEVGNQELLRHSRVVGSTIGDSVPTGRTFRSLSVKQLMALGCRYRRSPANPAHKLTDTLEERVRTKGSNAKPSPDRQASSFNFFRCDGCGLSTLCVWAMN
jgi:hypothetical protein